MVCAIRRRQPESPLAGMSCHAPHVHNFIIGELYRWFRINFKIAL